VGLIDVTFVSRLGWIAHHASSRAVIGMLIPESLSLVVAFGAGALVFVLPLALIYVSERIMPGRIQRNLVGPLSIFMFLMPIPVGYFFYAGGKTVLVIENSDGMTRSDWLAYGNPVYRLKDGSERRVGGPSFFYDGSTVVNDTGRPLILVEMSYYTKGTPVSSDPNKVLETLPPMSVTSLDYYIKFFGRGPEGPEGSVSIGPNASRVLVYWLTWPQAENAS